jgi:hypothetical protein
VSLAGLACAAAGCDLITGQSNITYEVTGTATRIGVIYENEQGSTSQIASTAVPWSYSFKAERHDLLYVSAQIVEGDGSITVTIRKGSSSWKTAFASGLGSTATTSGTLE